MRTWVRTDRGRAVTDAGPAVPNQPERHTPSVTPPPAAPAGGGLAPPPHVHALRLLPTPKGTPFTFWYTLVLVGTTLFIHFGDPAQVTRWLSGASADVENLAQEPLFVLFASALFYKGALLSVFTVGFVLVLTALERRVGGWRTAAVFLAGHLFATLATQLTVAAAVALGHLPESSRSRFDYGIDYGVLACAAALAGVLHLVWLRWAMVAGVGTMIVSDLVTLTDPVVDWGHLLAFLAGIALWPLLRRYQRRGSAAAAARPHR
ncbi:rhomboid-like protein [Streptomyces alkaliterrae]|uniref:rhomboid-like protein n=2 Tax=Streptomyces alkaliterrae TaxID=2213162 RepID=UPI001E373FCB|nr:rhomboid-like protein [Streptomyces alkaliterrae]